MGCTFPRTLSNFSFAFRFVNNLFMWESSVPTSTDPINPMFATANLMNGQWMNPEGRLDHDQAFQACRSMINRCTSHSSDDDQVLSDEDDDDGADGNGGRLTPRTSKKKGPHNLVLQLNIQDIHLAANAPSVILSPLVSLLSSMARHAGQTNVHSGCSLSLSRLAA